MSQVNHFVFCQGAPGFPGVRGPAGDKGELGAPVSIHRPLNFSPAMWTSSPTNSPLGLCVFQGSQGQIGEFGPRGDAGGPGAKVRWSGLPTHTPLSPL